MTIIETFTRKFDTRFLCLTLLSCAIAAAPLIGADVAATQESTQNTEQTHGAHAAQPAPAKLVQLVGDATGQFITRTGDERNELGSRSWVVSAARTMEPWAFTT